ncbi:DNA polymerase III subunit beta [Labrys sp. WJW]|uniref:DNA polymerase III subunit beta n=1 Tax=Labrys sp. WJW TaxID=1737983 RepID=UPI0008365460|nr:DNA polymerase III subunit beta [Labrys sp. WJW]OCC05230.1 DNA polymerase III subunit beta [Labrys sp. WJW]
MEIIIERAALVKALGTAQKIVERRNTIPILSNVALYADAGTLRIVATDLDLEASITVPAETPTPGQTTVPAHTFADIVRKLPDGAQIKLAEPTPGTIQITSGRSRFKLQTLPIEDYPDLAAGEMATSFALPAKTLAEMLEKTSFAISTEETRYYLNGIYLHAVAGQDSPALRTVATDGHRLARFEVQAPAGSEGLPGIIVPRKTVGELARLAKEVEGDITFEVSNAKIRVQAGNTRLTSKLIDGTFPDYSRVIPTGNDKIATLDLASFARAVDLVASISSERGRAVKLSFGEGRLDLAVTNPDAGDARQDLDVEYASTPIEIGFNSRYLNDALSTITGDTVQVALSEPGSPALFRTREGAQLLIVLMPMRV